MEINPFQDEVIKITSKLYCNFRLSRNDIQSIVLLFADFITNFYNPLLLKTIHERIFESSDSKTKSRVTTIFDKYSDPFQNVRTDKQRMALYSQLGLFVEPTVITFDEKAIRDVRGTEMTVKVKKVKTVHVPLKHSLTQLLEMDGLFEATRSYMKNVMSDDTLLCNFTQGSLWKEKVKAFDQNDIVLPLGYFYDEVETGNSQGTHAGENSVGCGYTTCLAFPPNFASKLDSILLTDIFYASDKREFGNKKVFAELINDMNNLRRYGITITVKKQKYQVYFILCVCLGDNKGLNDIFGFVKSFYRTHCCRFCYAGYEQWCTMTTEDISLLRTEEQYLNDLSIIQSKITGVAEISIFNELIDFNIIANGSVDLMHDCDEGVENYTMTNILLELINEEKFFDITFLNNILKTMDFGYEKANVPLEISMDYVQGHNKLKMSAAEMLFFTRYFGLMVGEMVPEENKYWQLYIKLREFINLVTMSQFTKSAILQLKIAINELLVLYIKCFGNLKSKFHTLLHYIRVILQNGPATKLSAMRFESKHREVRTIVQATSSRKNVLKTVGDRYILSLMRYKFSHYKDLNFECGKEIENDSTYLSFPDAKSKVCVSSATINDFQYKKRVIIVATFGDINPIFGEIVNVFIIDEKVYFQYKPLHVIGFNYRYYAYSVKEIDELCMIPYESLASRTPCLLDVKNGTKFVATRYML